LKLQVCQDLRNGVIGRRDAQRTYGVSAKIIKLRLTQFGRGELNNQEAEASVIAEHEAYIAALAPKVGQLTMKLGLVKNTAPAESRPQRELLHHKRPHPALPDGAVT
jgi:hypothetical protein